MHQLITRQSDTLIIYYAGWGIPLSAIAHLYQKSPYDHLLYHNHHLENTPLKIKYQNYRHIHLIAYSLGVLAAEQKTPPLPKLTSATAINGTPLAIDRRKGIPEPIFLATLNNLNPQTRTQFEKNMCGKYLSHYQNLPEQNDLETLKNELQYLYQLAQQPQKPLPWTKAIISEKDRIFPENNQIRYWQENNTPITHINAPHYLWQHITHWQQLWQ